ncbi:MAG: hypothetical protein J3R72DRAFT_464721 [Linnemannia gamsii]|nr:MAG: hypothetical protein J3R72DRAFT_464721 [Linnemannia gamsii]
MKGTSSFLVLLFPFRVVDGLVLFPFFFFSIDFFLFYRILLSFSNTTHMKEQQERTKDKRREKQREGSLALECMNVYKQSQEAEEMKMRKIKEFAPLLRGLGYGRERELSSEGVWDMDVWGTQREKE